MVTKLKAKYIPTYYELELFKKLQNLEQEDMTMKDYTKEFYKLTIWSRHRELTKEKVARYINGLRFNIQDEIGMLKIDSVEDAYQYALKEVDKLKRKSQGNSKGKEKQDSSTKAKPSAKDEPKSIDQKRRIGRGEFTGTCYRGGEVGHISYECPKDGDKRAAVVNEVENPTSELEK